MGMFATFEFGQAWIEAIARMGYDTRPKSLALTNRAVKGPVYRHYRRLWDEERKRSAIAARTFLSGRWFQIKREVAEPRDVEERQAA
ncbi:MAG TPA: hypothetical protein VGL20_13285 [Candidatus Dormibacteraeota bacterium]